MNDTLNKHNIIIAPSLLSCDFSIMGEEVNALESAGADWLHFDVMDGHFVPNLTFGPCVIKALRPKSKLFFDVHLMIEPVEPYIEAFAHAGADGITIHVEATKHVHRTITHIKSLGKKAGISLNPATPLYVLEEILPFVDLVLIMSVNPGFGGQSFVTGSLEKISRLASMIALTKPEIILEVDGGINQQNAQDIIQAGAQALVAGTAVFEGGNGHYAQNIANLKTGFAS